MSEPEIDVSNVDGEQPVSPDVAVEIGEITVTAWRSVWYTTVDDGERLYAPRGTRFRSSGQYDERTGSLSIYGIHGLALIRADAVIEDVQ